jgi:DNA mismatch repair ATPase MutS
VQVTFRFRLTQGPCPKSYGPSVALAAGIPRAIAERAVEISEQFETRHSSAHKHAAADAASSEEEHLVQRCQQIWAALGTESIVQPQPEAFNRLRTAWTELQRAGLA